MGIDRPPVRALLLNLYSERYPAIGESHGLSVVAGSLRATFPKSVMELTVIDMVEHGKEDCADVISAVAYLEINVLAIGLPYGTFNVFKRSYPRLIAALTAAEDALIILGGPIATYLGDRLLREISPEALIVQGEAEHVVPAVVRNWLDGRASHETPNLRYYDRTANVEVANARRLVDLSLAVVPYRDHIPSIRHNGGQIFAESSRGCSWAACTFCLRGLTDIKGRGYEYRRKNPQTVVADLAALSDLGVTDVTFADEDFLGSSLEEARNFFGQLQAANVCLPRFDASITVHSVYSRKDSDDERAARHSLLKMLGGLGLQKVFLGIESCSASQLRRYAKGHTREEALAAVHTLQDLGIRVEVGVILFDPLCTLEEVEDSLQFMRANDLVRLASGISSELRLQVGSTYLTMLRNFERQHGVKLCRDVLDPDTLAYPYSFLSPEVAEFFAAVGDWNRRLHPLYYPAKSLSRFGATGAIGDAVYVLRRAAEDFRNDSCDAMIGAIGSMRADKDGLKELNRGFRKAALSLSSAVLTMGGQLNSSPTGSHPVVQRVTAAARAIEDNYG